MSERIQSLADFLIEIEQLKLVARRGYVSDQSRRENSAEHSWHLAMGVVTVARELGVSIDLHKAVVMALIHDLCEIDAGDTPIYGPARADQHEAERRCMDRLAGLGISMGPEILALWLEYEAQETAEARWVKVMDRVMPFLVNLATRGRTWQELSVSRGQVLTVSEPVRVHAPEIFAWMRPRIDQCVADGWLLP